MLFLDISARRCSSYLISKAHVPIKIIRTLSHPFIIIIFFYIIIIIILMIDGGYYIPMIIPIIIIYNFPSSYLN